MVDGLMGFVVFAKNFELGPNKIPNSLEIMLRTRNSECPGTSRDTGLDSRETIQHDKARANGGEEDISRKEPQQKN